MTAWFVSFPHHFSIIQKKEYISQRSGLVVVWQFQYHIEIMQVACALLMAGENLDNHIDVKNILVQMGIYFQVQVI